MFLIDGWVSYAVENMSTSAIVFPFEAGIDLDIPFPSLRLPRFTSLALGRDEDHPADLVTGISASDEIAVLDGTHHSVFIEPDLELRDDHGELILRKLLEIPPRTKVSGDADEHAQVSVRYRFRRVLAVPGMLVLVTATPADGFQVRVSPTQDVSLDVTALHPSIAECVESPPTEWHFRKGILPWQGFIVRARPNAMRGVTSQTLAAGS